LEGIVRGRLRVIASAVGLAVFATAGAQAAGPDDGKAAFEHRVDTMKRMGHALYVTIGRVARGKAALGPDTVDAAQTIVSLSATIPSLFPAGSDVGDSRVKP
jgi:cytochrome c556